MLNKAIEKIKSEMDKNKDNGSVQFIGDFLLKQMELNKDAAVCILKEEKTILKSLEEMQKEALAKVKKRTGNTVYCMDPAEGLKIVLKYFGIEGDASVTPAAPIKPKEIKTNVAFNVSLNDLLG